MNNRQGQEEDPKVGGYKDKKLWVSDGEIIFGMEINWIIDIKLFKKIMIWKYSLNLFHYY